MKILIVDDEKSQIDILEGFLKKQKHTIFATTNPTDAVDILKKHSINLILSDYKMPEMTGEELFLKVKSINPEIKFIMLTAYGTIDTAVNIMKLGAVDFIQKPIDLKLLIEKITQIEENILLNDAKENIEDKIDIDIPFKNSKILDVYKTIYKIAGNDINVFISGESGTGKEIIAKTIHQLSSRGRNRFMAVNCAAIPDNLFESELFGYEKGAFTGAVSSRKGKFLLANNGTIFLDEIGEVPMHLQGKLLRVLQERQIEPLGSEKTIQVNIRLISATNKNIKEMVKRGEFREDLYYRLNVISIDLPPLRERKEDISVFIEYFLKNLGNGNITISSEAKDLLIKYHYPGNIRELENIIQRAIALSNGKIITAKELSDEVKLSNILNENSHVNFNFSEEIARLEKKLIFEALEKFNYNKTQAAKSLGINERVIRYKIKKYNL